MDMPRLLRPKEAARYLTLHPVTLAKMRIAGTGPKYLRYGTRSIRYRLSDLELWERSKEQNHTAEY